MNSRLTTALAAFLCVSLAACYPYDERRDRRPVPKKKVESTISSPEQQQIQAQREEMKKKDEAAKREAAATPPEVTNGTIPSNEAPKPPVEEKSADVPVAQKIPTKEGFVFSPFNNRPLDVSGIAPGTLVADPTYPKSEKKYFRVP